MERDQLREALERRSAAKAETRPILTQLNGDNSWLVFYHVVLDPWLAGPTTLLGAWVIHIDRPEPAAISTAEKIEELIRDIERSAAGSLASDSTPLLDAIMIGHTNSDHLHENTLRMFDPATPVIASKKASAKIQAFGHFDAIHTLHIFPATATSWNVPELHPGGPIPRWFTPLYVEGLAELNYSLAITWTHAAQPGPESPVVHETILQSPHGIQLSAGSLNAFLSAEPARKPLAMLHALKESYTLGFQSTRGVLGGLELWRKTGGVGYWLPTHESKLIYSGVMMRLLMVNDVYRSLDWALEEEAKVAADGEIPSKERPNLVEVANGQSIILE
ncbi:unnamed protein product [Parascedosporium putredinis]|uniref:Uncharacterized protein n=1 Tax=Parascedosporium putredinis TaxID=1442378 RepID=A0A9P1MDH6_9PEZI|nr:unnamed protein product [Parascedosporium putredinis]CAI8000614.1 unnamed protein product [Parascedosporium putredinis]